MENLKKELFFKLTTKNWLLLHYANEKFDLFFNQEQQEIKFYLNDKENNKIYLSGFISINKESIKFEYDKHKSVWFENMKELKNENINNLLENLFCSMLIQGDSK